jgi:hypothetical protein
VIFDTDPQTGLTHINHENLRVPANRLALHEKTICQYHLPINDAFSFEMIKKLRQKYADVDRKAKRRETPKVTSKMVLLAEAS